MNMNTQVFPSESQTIEYKESWRDEYLKWICGFANAKGGTLYIGINDQRQVVGVARSKELMEQIPNMITMTMGIMANIDLHQEQDKEYISIIVAQQSMPIAYKGKYYYRTGSTLQEFTGIALQDFLLSKGEQTWDNIPVPNTSMDDIDLESVEGFVRRSIRFSRMPSSALSQSPKHILNNLHLLAKDGSLTNAAILLFGKNPQRHFVGAYFRIGRFHSNESDLIFQDEISGNLINMPDAVMDLLKSKYLTSPIHYEGLQRIEQLEIPEEGLREIICNAIVHKDYRGVHTQMKVYDDYIRLWNEGNLMEGLTIDWLRQEHNSVPRNKTIARVFYFAGFIESWGRGIQIIDQSFLQAGLPVPQYKEEGGGITTIIPRNRSTQEKGISTQESTQESTPKSTQKKVVEYLSIKPSLTRNDLADLIGVTPDAIKKHLSSLQRKGILRRVGSTKGGHWEVVKN